MLVKNELIKLSLKIGTQILLILLILASAGLCLIFYFDTARSHTWYGGWCEMDELRLELQEWEQRAHTAPDDEHAREAIDRLSFMLEHNIKRWDYDWRTEFVDMVYWSGDPVLDRESVKSMIAADDWRGVYSAVIAAAEKSETEEREIWRFRYALEHDISPVDNSWKHAELILLSDARYSMEIMDEIRDAEKIAELKDEAAIMLYRLDNDVPRVVEYGSMMRYMYMGDRPDTDVWTIMESCVMMVPFMSVFIIIIAGGLVSSEFSRGTIKFLLISPVKRWKIFMSKYVVMLITGMVFLAVMFFIFFVLGGALTGFANMNAVNLSVSNEQVSSVPAFVYYVKLYMLGMVNITVMSSLAFALSSVSRNSGLAIAVSIAALIGGQIIDLILRGLVGVDWGRYLLFANADLVSIIYGGNIMLEPYKGQTLGFALAAIGVHMLIFMLTAWDGFTRKEI
jgi:ABC-2 type transport system permease protein